ncbi:phosphoribosyltransferase [Alkaliphilus oremlandii]|uniref:PELOTA RNA-binding domain-containing protein n=1 Tax=Alkaliphilus oremlandii (strain OhILAs) TaxID=350688 RepID=A8MM96_ALKOO|nr:phosphoribosyltransferase [Alkaliphilus oremlandii]ABW18263.1 conserved hypothetical protein [Alkaliphilus oremlandii OhILAs]
MKTNAIETYWQENNRYEYEILNDLKIKIEVTKNDYNIPLRNLFTMAARRNPKRSFLFVSKVLGKHIPINPHTGLLANLLLANRYMEEFYHIHHKEVTKKLIRGFVEEENCQQVYKEKIKTPNRLPEPTLFIGFAETATGIGQGVFSAFTGEGYYTHTTREIVLDCDFNVEFEEEHSHAKDHNCYGLNQDLLASDMPIVFIDDELTTGKTILNIIQALHGKYPRKRYAVLSILDWRGSEDRAKFQRIEKELDISIKVISLVSGSFQISGSIPMAPTEHNQEVAVCREEYPSAVEYMMLDDYFDEPLQHILMDENQNKKIVNCLKETGRFGISCDDQNQIDRKIKEIGALLQTKRTSEKTLCLGTEELIYLPMLIAAHMGDGVKYHATTRSPIHPVDKEEYGARNGFVFKSPGELGATNYIYNIPRDYYDDLFLILEREASPEQLESILDMLKTLGIPKIFIVFCLSQEKEGFTGSYKKEDVIFLLKDVSQFIEETDTEDKEEAIQGGTHYSEMLPVEYNPTESYIRLFHESLEESAQKIAVAVAVVSEKIIKNRGKNIVLVSLARAGTPIGILVKRYLEEKYHMKVPHYSVSIIRGKGIDENAIAYILQHHPGKDLQFVDGWTGKGAITEVLMESCKNMNQRWGTHLSSDLAVLADPGHCSATFGTREDFLIASACLNSTVSGLISRTVHREDLIGPKDFHGVKFYKELQGADVSNLFVDRIAAEFSKVEEEVKTTLQHHEGIANKITWQGLEDIRRIQKDFAIEDINLIKPGIGETTRVLLRRVPWKILVRDYDNPNLRHILLLAKDRNVEVEVYPQMTYGCCGLIKPFHL